jgi:hypothetical protein
VRAGGVRRASEAAGREGAATEVLVPAESVSVDLALVVLVREDPVTVGIVRMVSGGDRFVVPPEHLLAVRVKLSLVGNGVVSLGIDSRVAVAVDFADVVLGVPAEVVQAVVVGMSSEAVVVRGRAGEHSSVATGVLRVTAESSANC